MDPILFCDGETDDLQQFCFLFTPQIMQVGMSVSGTKIIDAARFVLGSQATYKAGVQERSKRPSHTQQPLKLLLRSWGLS